MQNGKTQSNAVFAILPRGFRGPKIMDVLLEAITHHQVEVRFYLLLMVGLFICLYVWYSIFPCSPILFLDTPGKVLRGYLV